MHYRSWFFQTQSNMCVHVLKVCTYYRKIPYIANCLRYVEKFCGFCRSIGTTKFFQWNSLCNRLWPCKTTVLTAKLFQRITVWFCNYKTFPPQTICNIRHLISLHAFIITHSIVTPLALREASQKLKDFHTQVYDC